MFGQNTFGSNTSSAPAFGTSTAFGGGGGGSLFNNQAKPGGLFGQQQTTSSGGKDKYSNFKYLKISSQASLELRHRQIRLVKPPPTPLVKPSELKVSDRLTMGLFI